MSRCSHCGSTLVIPDEPPLGTWVKDRFGGTHVRIVDSDRRDGWAVSPSGFYAFGQWEAMWEGRGPLEVCGPWGAEPTWRHTDGSVREDHMDTRPGDYFG